MDMKVKNSLGTIIEYKPDSTIEGGIKFDHDKPRLELLSAIALEEVAKVLTFGAKKYGPDNWRGGIKFTRLIGATLRHIFAYSKGELRDPESGLSHIAHASCCLLFLLEFESTKPYLDDLYKPRSDATNEKTK